MIVFAAFTPHTPLLLSTIGKSAHAKMTSTLRAMGEIQDALYVSQPNTIVIISAHATQHEQAFSTNIHDPYLVDLSSFGDLTTTAEFRPNLSFIDAMQRAMRTSGTPFTCDSDAHLDYGSAVPLVFLSESLSACKIVPISWSGRSAKDHFSFGKALQELCQSRPERIAIIASGDLSHTLTSDAPAGFRPEGKIFDQEVCQAIDQATVSTLLSLDQKKREQAVECGYFPLLILFGILDQMQVTTKRLSYEAPFGVGYLVAKFAV